MELAIYAIRNIHPRPVSRPWIALNRTIVLLAGDGRCEGDEEVVNQRCQIAYVDASQTVSISFSFTAQSGEGNKQIVDKRRQISDVYALTGIAVNVSGDAETATGVADAVVVGVFLTRIEDQGAVVEVGAQPIAIRVVTRVVRTSVTEITYAIIVGVFLTRIRRGRTVVEAENAVAVRITHTFGLDEKLVDRYIFQYSDDARGPGHDNRIDRSCT